MQIMHVWNVSFGCCHAIPFPGRFCKPDFVSRCHFWCPAVAFCCLAVTLGILLSLFVVSLSLFGVLPLLFSKADLSDVGGEVSAYDADHFAGDQGGQDGAFPDADAGIPEGDQVEAEDSEEDAD